MRYSKYFILPVALACFYGCVDEDFADHSGSQHNVEITARMDGEVSTRTCVGNSTDDGMVGILWTPGDCVGVYGTDGTRNALFASTNTGIASACTVRTAHGTPCLPQLTREMCLRPYSRAT